MDRTTLHDGWTLRSAGGPVPAHIVGLVVPARVPGTSHTDLLAAGLIEDPYVDLHETDLVWAHRARWRYASELRAAPAGDDERVDLVFEGIDTVAEISLGGRPVAATANQHRSYRFDVREHLAAAAGSPVVLEVLLSSALEHAEAEAVRIGARPGAYPHPLNMVRKMACSFGWDWGPDLQTAGIWRPVALERWRTARLASVRPLVTVDVDGAAHVAVHVDVERSGLELDAGLDAGLDVSARLGGREVRGTLAPGASDMVLEVVVPDPELWWPAGYGRQPLHDLEVRLAAGEVPLGSWHRRIGLRTVELDTSDDAVGTAFTFVVNGVPVFVKGANWIPDDHLLTRITRGRLVRRLDQAVEANLNLLRVWGGGIYESEDFYELCDERGLMVWQDFPLACSAYPEEEPHRSEIEAEAREHVARLVAHPSLVLLNGGNENIWGHEDWGWQAELGDLTWGLGYYTELFPRTVAELAPTVPYAVGSPSSPRRDPADVHPNDPDHGTHHQWEVWNRVDYAHYRDDVPRFSSEFGFQGPPTWATLERAVRTADGSPLTKDDPVWSLHQKAEDGDGKLDRGLSPHLGVPVEFTDWHWATQLNQARAVAHAIDHYRSWWPRTAGSVVWQLNDCWPVTSWAAIDGDGRPKPLWWALRAAYADRVLTVQPREDGGGRRDVLAVVNDTDEAWTGTVAVRRERLDGTLLAAVELGAAAAPRSVELLGLPDVVRVAAQPAEEVLVATLGDVRTVHCFVEDVDLDLDPDPLDVQVATIDGGYRVQVRARSLVKDLALLVDRLDPRAQVDASLVTLPAGASVTFQVSTAVRGLADRLGEAPVLRTANDLARGRARRGRRPQRVDLTDGWSLRLRGEHVPAALRERDVPATVPGVVHTDLLAAGLIPDPYLGTAEREVQWVAETDAVYRTTFDRPGAARPGADGPGADGERADLVVDGLDTVATIVLNGHEVARTRNQHRSYRFDVRQLLRAEGNELVVSFEAPLRAAREAEQRIGARPLVGDALPYNALRKMACNFGWDWGPTLTTAGVWRPIGVETWSVARIAQAVPQVTVEDGTGHVEVRVDLERAGAHDVELALTLTAPDGTPVARAEPVQVEGTTAHLRLVVPDPQLWWPRGHGDQPLYELRAELTAAGAPHDSWHRRVGFRTAEVRMEPDAFGTSFQVVVNGRPVWIKGANWIPADCFPSRVTAQDYARGVADAVEAGMTMLRVWGGGLYESDELYDLCDREGLLVWQDFAFACAMYSEDPELWDEVEAEAREHVARLAPHPSLVLWNGSNENIEGFHHWGFAERMPPGEDWGRGYYEDLLPGVLAAVDPTRAYIPSSPWNPVDDADPRHPDHGPVHSWRVWFTEDYPAYRDAVPRFVAEFGFQAPAAYSTLIPAAGDEHPAPGSPGMAQHQKSEDGNRKLARGWEGHLPGPTTFDDWYATTQVAQVRAVSTAVAHYRSHWPRTGGYLVWQLNDCWPAVSWSLVDVAGRRKPLWYALRSLNAPRVLLLQPRDGGPALIASNDTDEPWTPLARVRRVALDGTLLGEQDVRLDVLARQNATVALSSDVAEPEDGTRELLLVDDDSDGSVGRAWWTFVEDVDLDLPAPAFTTDVERTGTGYRLTLTATTLVKDLLLSPDRLDPDAVVDQELVTLLPGESHTYRVRTPRDLDASALIEPPVLTSVSHLCHAGSRLLREVRA